MIARATAILKLEDVENTRNGGIANKTISLLAETEYFCPKVKQSLCYIASEPAERSSIKALRILRAGIIYTKITQNLFYITTAAILDISITNIV